MKTIDPASTSEATAGAIVEPALASSASGVSSASAEAIEGRPDRLLDPSFAAGEPSAGAGAVSHAGDRHRVLQRVLEIVPGLMSWTIILAPILIAAPFGLNRPELVAWFVLCFDFYWLYRAVELCASVVISFVRLRFVLSHNWRERSAGLADPVARIAFLEERITAVEARRAELRAAGNRHAAMGGARELKRLRDELGDLRRLVKSGESFPDASQIWHVALIPTYTEPYEKLHETVRALAEADWPKERKMVAIITRETDMRGRENIARLREQFGDSFCHFFHILDPLVPGIVVGKSSAMAWGGRWLYRELTENLGFDPEKVVVTDLDSDYRVHPQYFGYLTHVFVTDPNRFMRLYQPIPMFHNNLWQTPAPVRMIAVGGTQTQLWRSLSPEKLVSFSSYAVSLKTVHEVDYWATDAIPEDSRFYWKSFFRYSGKFRAAPLFIPIYGDAVRAKSYPRTLVEQYTQIRRWAWGVTDIPFYVRQALAHSEIPRSWRIKRLVDLWADHLNWAVAPFVMLFGSNLPLLLNEQFRATPLGQQLPTYAAWMLTAAFSCSLILIFVEERIAPPRPKEWTRWQRIFSLVQWALVPVAGIVFSNLPALDAQTRLMTGRYLEYKVTPKN